MRRQFEILPPEGVAFLRCEIGKRHLERPADFGVHVMHLGRKSIGRQPFHHGIRVQERPVNPFWCRTKHAMESNGIRCHASVSFPWVRVMRFTLLPYSRTGFVKSTLPQV